MARVITDLGGAGTSEVTGLPTTAVSTTPAAAATAATRLLHEVMTEVARDPSSGPAMILLQPLAGPGTSTAMACRLVTPVSHGLIP